MSNQSDYNDHEPLQPWWSNSPSSESPERRVRRGFKSQLLDLEKENAHLRTKLSKLSGLERERASTIRALKAARERELEYAALRERYQALEVLASEAMELKTKNAELLKLDKQRLEQQTELTQIKQELITEQDQLAELKKELELRMTSVVNEEKSIADREQKCRELNSELANQLLKIEQLHSELQQKQKVFLSASISIQKQRHSALKRNSRLKRVRTRQKQSRKLTDRARKKDKLRSRLKRHKRQSLKPQEQASNAAKSTSEAFSPVVSILQGQVQSVAQNCTLLSQKFQSQELATMDLSRQFETLTKNFAQTESKLQQKLDQLAEKLSKASQAKAVAKPRSGGAMNRARHSQRSVVSAPQPSSRSAGRASPTTPSRAGAGGGLLAGLMKQNIELMRD